MSTSFALSIEKFDIETTEECFCVDPHLGIDLECLYCNGTGENVRPVARFTHINMGNESWSKITSFLNLPLFGEDRVGGEISAEQTSAWLRCILRAKNSNGAGKYTEAPYDKRAHAPRIITDEDGMMRISQGARSISFGYTEERLMGHVNALESTLLDAQQHECGVSWY